MKKLTATLALLFATTTFASGIPDSALTEVDQSYIKTDVLGEPSWSQHIYLNRLIDGFDRYQSQDCEASVENSENETQRFRLHQTDTYKNCMNAFYKDFLTELGVESDSTESHKLYKLVKETAFDIAGIDKEDRDQWGRPLGETATLRTLNKVLDILKVR